MAAIDLLYFFIPFIVGIVVFFKAGHKFYSTTAVLLTGIFLVVYFSDTKPFWMTLAAYVAMWGIIFVIPERIKR